ncbi:MAG: AAA family ATPase [Acidobacteria bacterium]|nr:AAA family ATPase [Acidobacteriota bacterium]
MKERNAKIQGKTVQLSPPYQGTHSRIVARENEMRKVLAAWMGRQSSQPLSPLLVGEPGVGKNRIVYECARLCDKELYIFQGHEDVTAEDLICSVRFSDDPGKKMDYIVSPLVTAMLRGGVCFIDEIAKIRPRALAPLASILDERRYVDSVLLGERIHAHRGFRFIAATNTDDLDETPLPEFIRSRMRPVIRVEYPERSEIDGIIRSHFEEMKADGSSLLDRFWELWTNNGINRPPTPRDSIYIFGYALNLADFESLRDRRPCNLESDSCESAPIEEKHLDKAFDVFRESTRRDNNVPSTHIHSSTKQ